MLISIGEVGGKRKSMFIFSAVYFIVFMTTVVYCFKETYGHSIRYSQQKELNRERKAQLKRFQNMKPYSWKG